MERQKIYSLIVQLVRYGVDTGLVDSLDQVYVTNQLMDLLQIEATYEEVEIEDSLSLSEILSQLVDYAAREQLFTPDIPTTRDLFDTKIMGLLVPNPSVVVNKFWNLYKDSSQAATDYYYKLSCDSNYIRRDRIKKDVKWKVPTEYGDMDLTINLSKPEKDPRAIAAQKLAKSTAYPKCQLCKENEGYAGRMDHPARQNHRIIPIELDGKQWFMQYSPYVYYNEHCIVFNEEHIPMVIDQNTFRKLFDFIKLFPHYTVGSNADLPIVGGSILSHEHYQGGRYTFAMEKAPIETSFQVKGYKDVEAGIVKWPMSVIRLSSKDSEQLIALADHILTKWRGYSDPACEILAMTDGESHNTITPIARKKKDRYELDLVLRNNRTTSEHPLGIFHPHEQLHHIKKENIGLIEVMGLAIFPPRLKEELELLEQALIEGRDITKDERLAVHAEWAKALQEKYDSINKANAQAILKKELGIAFTAILEDAGVFKQDENGKQGFKRFVSLL